MTSGTTANDSCRLSTTCESTSRRVHRAARPRSTITATGGHDGEPAADHAPQPRPHAHAQEALHHDLPGERAGDGARLPGATAARPRTASRPARCRAAAPAGGAPPRGCATSWWPRRWNAAAASTRIAALTKNAQLSATTESTRFMRQASRLPALEFVDRAALHQRAVQVEIVRHHRGAEDAHGDVQRLAVQARAREQPPAARARTASSRPSSPRGTKAAQHARRGRGATSTISTAKQPPMVAISVMMIASSRRMPSRDERQQQQHVERGDAHAARRSGRPNSSLQPDRGAQHLGQIARDDGDLAQQPQRHDHGRAGTQSRHACARSRAGDHAEPRGERLQQHRHEVAHQQHPHRAGSRIARRRRGRWPSCPGSM